MALFKVLSVLLFALGSTICSPHGISHGKSHTNRLGIYAGIPSTIQRHPFMVAIHWMDVFTCAGSIIGDQWVLSSALCLDSLDAEDLSVIAASNDAYTGDVYQVDQLIFHPKYDVESMDYSFALVKTSEAFVWKSKVKAIALPTEALPDLTRTMVSGWGFSGNGETTMKQGGMKWMPKDTCKSTYETIDINWTDRMACAYNKGKTTLCSDDYGDPIVHKGVIYGVFVFGYPNGICSSYASPIMLADVYQAVDWIQETLDNE